MINSRVLITGITGQAGSYLADLLIEKGYEVWGLIRRNSQINYSNITHIETKIKLIYGDLADSNSIRNAIKESWPSIIFNAAAQSHVKVSFDIPEYTVDIVGTAVFRLLECIKELKPDTKIIQFGSSEQFGKVQKTPQNEKTKFYPRSPYACAKVMAYHAMINYRESYGIQASNAIFFNYESPRRGEDFVTRKITLAVAKIKAGLQDKLILGNLDAKRDWGYAPDYMKAVVAIAESNKPDDYIISAGEFHAVKEFVEKAFKIVDLDWKKYVETDPKFLRPAEVNLLLGDSSKIKKKLGWAPEIMFDELVKIMVDADMKKKCKNKEQELKVFPEIRSSLNSDVLYKGVEKRNINFKITNDRKNWK